MAIDSNTRPRKEISLRSYQQAILDDLKYMPAIALFMGTGTGKTLTSLARVKDNPTEHLLVLCPAKVVPQWMEVIKDYTDYDVIEFKPKWTNARKMQYIEELYDENWPEKACIVYALESVSLAANLYKYIGENWTVIVDESHKIKELGSKKSPVAVTKTVLRIGIQTPWKIILTATPTQKEKGGYIDYFSQIKFLGYYDMSVEEFKQRYCIEKKIQPIGMPFPIRIISGYKYTEEIEELLGTFARHYTAKFGDFEPQHIRITLPAPHNYARLVEENFYERLDLSNLSARRIARKTLCTGVVIGTDIYKKRLVYKDNLIKLEWLEEFLSNTDETVVIFYKYNVEGESLAKLCEHMKKKYIVISGATKDKIAEIKKPDYDVVIGNFAALGESIDGLQYRSHICIYFCMPESSLEFRQALGRIDRDGQTKVPMYYYLVTEKTIEDSIYKMIQSKMDFNEDILNRLTVEGGV